ncbi:hypothetical protein [Leptolyngbya iicbica]|uniref:Uncharacterized protein n=2 Tax=Cyanophyceae TaxID=3028117 RepID=A0A4Q7E6T9_9CYAN|nr:hypothetical protein [Leptolyngbya sp. LK]RZM77759.1 hypothetical protein DYY88_14365 [Leptolyngbya sp. LK]
MADRVWASKIGALLLTTAMVSAIAPLRSLQAQTTVTPPPLQQLVHSFDISQPEATAYALWNEGRSDRHEVWFRIISGEADFQQRLRVYKEQAAPRSPDMLPPLSTLVYEIDNNDPSQWFYLGSESGFFTYYFEGDNRLIGAPDFENAHAVRVQKSIYNNGDYYQISFEDISELDDYDDLEIEVILIRR